MTNKIDILNFLGLAKRAGMILTGEEILLNAIKKHKIKFLFIASDTGSASYKKFKNKANYYNVRINDVFSKNELSDAIGSKRTIIGITDNGFAKRLEQMTNKSKGT